MGVQGGMVRGSHNRAPRRGCSSPGIILGTIMGKIREFCPAQKRCRALPLPRAVPEPESSQGSAAVSPHRTPPRPPKPSLGFNSRQKLTGTAGALGRASNTGRQEDLNHSCESFARAEDGDMEERTIPGGRRGVCCGHVVQLQAAPCCTAPGGSRNFPAGIEGFAQMFI